MFGSTVLEVAIGLVLVYLLISIILTSVSEAIEAMLKTRASDLEHALSQIFQGNPQLLQDFYEHPLVSGLYRGDYKARSNVDATRARSNGRMNLPSYIPRDTFSAVVMELAGGNEEMKKAIGSLAARVGVDAAGSRRALEAWYDGAMDRASGWFKRRTQRRLFVLGLLIALIGNVNSVTIGQYLALNQEARQAVVELADQARTTMPPAAPDGDQSGNSATENAAATDSDAGNATAATGDADAADASNANAASTEEADAADAAPADSAATENEADADPAASNAAQPATDAPAGNGDRGAWARDNLGQLRAIGLPIGWSDPVIQLTAAGFPPSSDHGWSYNLRWLLAALILLAGYLATAFAVMLGAPFWFDLLNKLMVVRSTVKPREKSPDEPPVDGPAPPNR